MREACQNFPSGPLVVPSDSYFTVARDAAAEVEIKRSRFLGTATRVDSEVAAREVVAQARREYWDARHHCSAFVLGPRGEVQRSSDDGEPSGTAGAPILDVINGHQLSDVVVVVTRWFGGVLLGTGGLVRAYAESAGAAVAAAGVQRRALVAEYFVELDHAQAGRVESDLRARGIEVLGVDYAAAVNLRLGVPAAQGEELPALLSALTASSVTPRLLGTRWTDVVGGRA